MTNHMVPHMIAARINRIIMEFKLQRLYKGAERVFGINRIIMEFK